MRTIAPLVVLVLLLLPPAVAADAVVVDGPRISLGDTWTYRTNTSLTSGLSLDGFVGLTVTGHATRSVEGRNYEAYEMSVTGAGTAAGTFSTQFGSTPASGVWVLTGREVVEARGLKVVSSVLDLQANGTLHTQPFPLSFTLSVQNTTSYRLVEDVWRFPLTVGDRAIVSGQMNFSEDFRLFYGFPTSPIHSAGLARWNVTYAMEEPVGIDTPAGRFETYPIRETYADGSFTRFFYAPAAGNHARTEARNGTSEVASADLVGYRYQALEPSRFIGLTGDQWALVVIALGIGGAVVVWWIRRTRKSAPPREGVPPPAP